MDKALISNPKKSPVLFAPGLKVNVGITDNAIVRKIFVAKVAEEKTPDTDLFGPVVTPNLKPNIEKIGKIKSAKHKAYLNSKQIQAHLPMVLNELFPEQIGERDDLWHLPNDYARCSLFTVRSRKEPRKTMLQEKLFHYNADVTILYTGSELRAEDDELVWLKIMSYGKDVAFGEPFSFHIKDIVRDINWARNGRSYHRVRQCISRLSATEVLIRNTAAFGVNVSLSLIGDYESVNDEDGDMTHYRVWVNPTLMLLFAGNQFTSHAWKVYRDLSPAARRLADYVGSHEKPFPLAVDKFKASCGSTNSNVRSWRQTVSKACAELQEKGIAEVVALKGDSIYITRRLRKSAKE